MSPAIEGMKQAHKGGFAVSRAGFHDRGHHDLNESASGTAEDYRKQKRGIGRQKFRKKSETGNADAGKQLCKDYGLPRTEKRRKTRSNGIGEKLNAKGDGNQRTDFGVGELKLISEGDKQKRCKVDGDCLRNIADKAGNDGGAMCEFH